MGKVDKLSIFPTLNSVGNYVVDSHVDKKWGLVMYDDVRVRILSNTVNTMFLVMLLFIIKSNIKSNLKVWRWLQVEWDFYCKVSKEDNFAVVTNNSRTVCEKSLYLYPILIAS